MPRNKKKAAPPKAKPKKSKRMAGKRKIKRKLLIF